MARKKYINFPQHPVKCHSGALRKSKWKNLIWETEDKTDEPYRNLNICHWISGTDARLPYFHSIPLYHVLGYRLKEIQGLWSLILSALNISEWFTYCKISIFGYEINGSFALLRLLFIIRFYAFFFPMVFLLTCCEPFWEFYINMLT